MSGQPWWKMWTPRGAVISMTIVGFLSLLMTDALKGEARLAEMPMNLVIAFFVGLGFGLVLRWKQTHEGQT